MVYRGKTLLKWMIWGYFHFRKPPYTLPIHIYVVSLGFDNLIWLVMILYQIMDYISVLTIINQYPHN